MPKRSAGSEPPCTQWAQSSPCPAQTGPNKGKTRLGERISSRDALSKSPLRWGGSRRGPGSPRQPRAPRDVPTSPAPGSCCRRPQRPAPGGLIRQTISHLFPTDFLKPTPAPPHCGLRLQTAVEDSSNQSLCFALALSASRGSRGCHVGKLPRANEASESSAGALQQARRSAQQAGGLSEPNLLFSEAQQWEVLSTDPSRRPQGDFCHGYVLKEAPSKAFCKQHATSADLAGPCHLLPAPSRWRGAARPRGM